jgi:hypothetical protein
VESLTESITIDEATLADVDAQLRDLEAQKSALVAQRKNVLESIEAKQNEAVLSEESRSLTDLVTGLNAIYDPSGWGSNDFRALTVWARGIDPAFTYRGDGIASDENIMFPVFEIELPAEVTDETVRNVSLLAQAVSTIHPARITIAKEVVSDYDSRPALNFVGTDGKFVIEKSSGRWALNSKTEEPLRTALIRIAATLR